MGQKEEGKEHKGMGGGGGEESGIKRKKKET
jgi:hypothetical protein